jgi:hypothetical protein
LGTCEVGTETRVTGKRSKKPRFGTKVAGVEDGAMFTFDEKPCGFRFRG